MCYIFRNSKESAKTVLSNNNLSQDLHNVDSSTSVNQFPENQVLPTLLHLLGSPDPLEQSVSIVGHSSIDTESCNDSAPDTDACSDSDLSCANVCEENDTHIATSINHDLS